MSEEHTKWSMVQDKWIDDRAETDFSAARIIEAESLTAICGFIATEEAEKLVRAHNNSTEKGPLSDNEADEDFIQLHKCSTGNDQVLVTRKDKIDHGDLSDFMRAINFDKELRPQLVAAMERAKAKRPSSQ